MEDGEIPLSSIERAFFAKHMIYLQFSDIGKGKRQENGSILLKLTTTFVRFDSRKMSDCLSAADMLLVAEHLAAGGPLLDIVHKADNRRGLLVVLLVRDAEFAAKVRFQRFMVNAEG